MSQVENHNEMGIHILHLTENVEFLLTFRYLHKVLYCRLKLSGPLVQSGTERLLELLSDNSTRHFKQADIIEDSEPGDKSKDLQAQVRERLLKFVDVTLFFDHECKTEQKDVVPYVKQQLSLLFLIYFMFGDRSLDLLHDVEVVIEIDPTEEVLSQIISNYFVDRK